MPIEASELEKIESKTRSPKRKRRNKVTIRDAKGTDEEMDSSEGSSDETDQSQITYRSVDLSDCSLPFSDQENTSPTDSTEASTKGPHVFHFTRSPAPIPFQSDPTPSTKSGHFLFPLRIPDQVNKQDWFEHPHPDAPKTFTEAMKRSDAQEWKLAMDEELKSMQELHVWEEIQRSEVPPGAKLLPWKWVFTYKDQKKPKARLVIVGSVDTEKYDVAQTFSPVAPPYVIRWFLSYTHKQKFDVSQIDIKTAFLHSTLPQKRYAFIPQGLQTRSAQTILKLLKAAYGLAISPLLWFQTFTAELKTLGFVQSLREPCLLYRYTSDGYACILVYVDDVLIATSSHELTLNIIQSLERKFRVKRLGYPRTYVGFEIERSDTTGELILHQRMYARTLLDAFLPDNERGHRKVPLNTFGNFPSPSKSQELLPQSFPYRSIIGTLYYYANAT